MEFKNDFQVENPLDEVWNAFVDVEKVAVCLPGAQLLEADGDEYKGLIKVKVGPITSQYKGVATILEQDLEAKKIVIKAEGRDSKGAGNASAIISVELLEESGNTKVSVQTDLSVTGKVAQFGRGVMVDISAKLMDQFADNLRESLKNPKSPDDEQSSKEDSQEVEAVDILEGAPKIVKVAGNVTGGLMKTGQEMKKGVKKVFGKKPNSSK